MEKHLAEEEIAFYLDALVLNVQDQVPAELLEHVADCFECKVEVMEVLELMEAISPHMNEPHPFFARM